MKKLIPVLVLTIILFCFLSYKYTQTRNRDITYTVEKYLKSGVFNTHKLYSIDTFQIVFTDDYLAIINVNGTLKKVPHKNVTYEILLEKKKNGSWQIKKIINKT